MSREHSKRGRYAFAQQGESRAVNGLLLFPFATGRAEGGVRQPAGESPGSPNKYFRGLFGNLAGREALTIRKEVGMCQ